MGNTGSMSDPTKSKNSADEARAEALDWLAGRFRWESLLADLHDLAERQAAPVVELEHRHHDDRGTGDHSKSENTRKVS